MKINVNKAVVALGAATGMLVASGAHAEVFGGIEYGHSVDTNFNGASGAVKPLEETIRSYSAYLGHYVPAQDNRSAFIVRAEAQANRLDTATVLDNNLFGLSIGSYQVLGATSSMTATISARAKRFDDDRRDGEIYGVSLGFKQKAGDGFSFREGLGVEHGVAAVSTGNYDGYSVNASANWRFSGGTALSLGAGWNRRIYDVLVAEVRTNAQATLGVVQEVGKHMYMRLSATYQENRANDGSHYDGAVYSFGVGVNL